MNVLIASRSESVIAEMRAHIAGRSSYSIETLLMVNGDFDPLSQSNRRVDVLVLHGNDRITDTLEVLAHRHPGDRTALVVVGELPADAVKYAMRAGARDFIGDHQSPELLDSLRRLEQELYSHEGSDEATILGVVNAKGGCGSSFLASSIAHVAVRESRRKAVLVDLDLLFAPLPQYLDLNPARGLMEALMRAPELDEMALQAYVAAHSSGLHVMAAKPEAPAQMEFDLPSHGMRLLEVLKTRYELIVLDVPRYLDDLSAGMLQAAGTVLVVTQPTLMAVRDAVRMKTMLTRDLAIAERRILSVVNRHSRHSSLELDDIRSALAEADPAVVPNQYRLVSECLDVGEALLDRAPGAAVTRAILELERRISGRPPVRPRGLLASAVSRLRG